MAVVASACSLALMLGWSEYWRDVFLVLCQAVGKRHSVDDIVLVGLVLVGIRRRLRWSAGLLLISFVRVQVGRDVSNSCVGSSMLVLSVA